MAARGVTTAAVRSGSLWASRSSVRAALSSMIFRSSPERFPVKKPRGSSIRWATPAWRMFRAVRKAAMWVHISAAKYRAMLATANHTAIQPQRARPSASVTAGKTASACRATSHTHT